MSVDENHSTLPIVVLFIVLYEVDVDVDGILECDHSYEK